MLKILHLYYDIMNMYGENANVRALLKSLDRQQVKYKVDFKSLEDKIDILKYDFIYIGTGLDESYFLVLNNLKKYQKELQEYINTNKFILATGNSLNLFSDLNILNFKIKQVDFRIVGEQTFNTKFDNKLIIGFQNRDTVIEEANENNLFNVLKGTGYDPNSKKEGIKKNNFYGTYLLGPLLIRNPYFLEYLTKELLKANNLPYKKPKEDISYKAYHEFIKNFVHLDN